MEKKQNKLILASAVIGALFVVGVIIFWVFIVRTTEDFSLAEFITGVKNIFNSRDKAEVLFFIGIFLVTVSAFLSFIFNLIGWIKGNSRYILIAGILYVLGLNLLSAPLCFVEYFDEKREIKNKLLFFTGIYTFIFTALLTALFVATAIDDKTALKFSIYTISAISAGVILNFIAWKTDNSIAKTAAGIAYILSILAIISGVICIICARHFLKAIKNKLLFYALVFVCVLGIPCIILMQTTVVPREGESPLIYSHTVYFLITTGIGFILNLFAWKTNNKKVKILAGIAYILGLFTVISAILCFVSCKDNRKMPDAGKKSAGGVDV